jgi:hypothetical protein
MKQTEQSLVGDLINFRGLVYSPLNENGVVFLFGKVAEDLNMYVEEIKPGFPDYIARRFTGKGWERLRVEFEYRSSNFKQHGHDSNNCDMIICWEHDWNDCSLEVVELKDRIKAMENRPIKRPDKSEIEGKQRDIESWFDNHRVQQTPRMIFQKLMDYVNSLNEECYYNIGRTNVNVYCPERVFLYLFPHKSIIRLNIFTQGKPRETIKQFDFERGAEKWGGLSIATEEELDRVLPSIKESYERIHSAVKNNEPTGWYAKVEDISDDRDISNILS